MITDPRPRPLNYLGGKQAYSRAPWIAGLLPWDRQTCYVEPFGGMASVLCYRSAVKMEIYNDMSGDIVNWWRCLQSRRDEMIEMIEATPHARAELQRAGRILSAPWTPSDEPDLQRAHAVYILLQTNQKQLLRPHHASFALKLATNVGSLGRWRHERVAALSERIWNVQLECCDAVELLERCVDREYVVAYVDPPYPTATGIDYGYTCDYDALTDVLLRQSGLIAVSGYGDEWDHLDWQKHTKCDAMGDIRRGTASDRVEVLWTSYDASQHGSDYAGSMAIAARWRERAERRARDHIKS